MDHVEDKRQAILDATLKPGSNNGFHGTAMSKVAREAGVSTGIIYHYFESKDELIDELYKDIKRKSAQAILEDLDQTQPVKTQIRQILGNVIRYSVNRPQESAFVEQYKRSPYHHSGIEAELSQHYQPIMECFERARKETIIKDLPLGVISILTLELATSLAQKQAGGMLTLTEELVEQIIDASWEAIRQ